MKLLEVLQGLDYEVLKGNTDTEIREIQNDSRKVQPGDLFFCISGAVSDGHTYAEDVAAKGAAVIAMCVEGKLLSSEALARQLAGYAAGGTSKVCFLVGGSFGLDEGLKREASLRLSMSPMTFPHHLARVMLAEQIYRACTINAGTQYHK